MAETSIELNDDIKIVNVEMNTEKVSPQIQIVTGEVIEEESPDPVYIVRINMSTPMRVLSSEMLDEITEKKVFKFDKETRGKIATVRCRVRRPMADLMFDFGGLWLCSDANIADLQHYVDDANREMQAIDSSLSAEITIIPLDVMGMRNTKAQHQIIQAIRIRMRDEISERITAMRETGITKKGNLNAKMVKTSIKMLERLKTLNVFADAATDIVLNKAIEDLRKTLNSELSELDNHLNKLEEFVVSSFTRVEVD
jgi:hypothetical protein